MRKYSTREISLQRPGHPANLITHCVRTPHQPPRARYAGASQPPPPREITFLALFSGVCVCVCARERERRREGENTAARCIYYQHLFVAVVIQVGMPEPPTCWPTPLTCLPAFRPASNLPAYLPLSLCPHPAPGNP
jgi:hypothetical protein